MLKLGLVSEHTARTQLKAESRELLRLLRSGDASRVELCMQALGDDEGEADDEEEGKSRGYEDRKKRKKPTTSPPLTSEDAADMALDLSVADHSGSDAFGGYHEDVDVDDTLEMQLTSLSSSSSSSSSSYSSSSSSSSSSLGLAPPPIQTSSNATMSAADPTSSSLPAAASATSKRAVDQNKTSYWAKGTGYGVSGQSQWDMKDYYAAQVGWRF